MSSTLLPKACWVIEHPKTLNLYSIANGKLVAFTDCLTAQRFLRMVRAPPLPPRQPTMLLPRPLFQAPRLRVRQTEFLRRRCALNNLELIFIYPDATQVLLTPDTYGLAHDDVAFHLDKCLMERA